jgi:hypothetical protein
MVMKGLFKAFQPKFETELPTKQKMTFDLMEDKEKQQHETVKKNQKAMMQFVSSFRNILLLNKLNCKNHRDKTNWPTEKAHHVMSAIVKEYKPEDIMAEMKMEQALAKMELGPKKDPDKLLNELASIECRHLLELSKPKKKAQILRLRGTQYSSIIATTLMIYCKNECNTHHQENAR